MSPELAQRLRALEHQSEALALQAAALAEQVAALVSEAEGSEAAGPALVTQEPKGPQFYGQTETKKDAQADTGRSRPSTGKR